MDDFTELQRLLRLKRHETPPEDFFEDFLRDFHEAQRGEMLKRSVWRIARDRLESLWPEMPVGRYAYAGSCAAALLVAGVTSARILKAPVVPPSKSAGFNRLASAAPKVDFYASHPVMGLAELDFNKPGPVPASAASRPRYVLDSQPVRYEQPSSF